MTLSEHFEFFCKLSMELPLLCPWARHLMEFLYLWVVRLLVTDGYFATKILTRWPQRSFYCILVEVSW